MPRPFRSAGCCSYLHGSLLTVFAQNTQRAAACDVLHRLKPNSVSLHLGLLPLQLSVRQLRAHSLPRTHHSSQSHGVLTTFV